MTPYSAPGISNRPKRYHNGKDIMKTVRECFKTATGIDLFRLIGSSREMPAVEYRQLAMWALYRYTDMTFDEVGSEFMRDHTTAMYAVDKVDDNLLRDDILSTKELLELALKQEGFIMQVKPQTRNRKSMVLQKMERQSVKPVEPKPIVKGMPLWPTF